MVCRKMPCVMPVKRAMSKNKKIGVDQLSAPIFLLVKPCMFLLVPEVLQALLFIYLPSSQNESDFSQPEVDSPMPES